jgi:hypothetical protein
MKPDTSPLVSKLTLLVLILILACLVLLVVRSYQKGSPLHEVAAIETESPAPLEPAPVAITPVAAPPVRRTAEMPVASKPITKPSPTNPPGEAPAESSVPRTIGIVRSGPTDHRPPVVHETLAANGSALLAGMVTLKGTPKPEIPIELGPTCGALQPKPRHHPSLRRRSQRRTRQRGRLHQERPPKAIWSRSTRPPHRSSRLHVRALRQRGGGGTNLPGPKFRLHAPQRSHHSESSRQS